MGLDEPCHGAVHRRGPGSPRGAAQEAAGISQFQGGGAQGAASVPHFIRLDFAEASRSVFYAMAVFMAVAAIVALAGLRGGRQQEDGLTAAASQPGRDQQAGVSRPR